MDLDNSAITSNNFDTNAISDLIEQEPPLIHGAFRSYKKDNNAIRFNAA